MLVIISGKVYCIEVLLKSCSFLLPSIYFPIKIREKILFYLLLIYKKKLNGRIKGIFGLRFVMCFKKGLNFAYGWDTQNVFLFQHEIYSRICFCNKSSRSFFTKKSVCVCVWNFQALFPPTTTSIKTPKFSKLVIKWGRAILIYFSTMYFSLFSRLPGLPTAAHRQQ